MGEIELDRNNTWYYDQWITTHGLLKHRICTVPKTSGLWVEIKRWERNHFGTEFYLL